MTVRSRELIDPFPGRPALPQLGMMIFLASDLMLFAGFFAANFLLKARSADWPPPGVELDVRYSTIFTVVLVSSSVTYVIGMRRFKRTGDARTLRRWTLLTMVLGLAFLLNSCASTPPSTSPSRRAPTARCTGCSPASTPPT